ncbi:MAG: bifunctional demethylmenaquinone methyltransferase/2-methoxy-6-polyprenyl-1,4-benzoquinol methylase UbiE [Gammaproteobacteria bacterium]|nr:bifunctional demethylmenaquinone methyltransferase/2-methoxy-6-polyprenyl-1,4-benzoquinol methylase UbiE [Gammaproteobacteria bacterium]
MARFVPAQAHIGAEAGTDAFRRRRRHSRRLALYLKLCRSANAPSPAMPPSSSSRSRPGSKSGYTHFGYEEVPVAEKARRVGAVFSAVATRYDLMNDLMSLGIHRLWKRFAIDLAGVAPGERVLDVAGGTGDLTAAFARQAGPRGMVVLSDINGEMLRQGRARLLDRGVAGVPLAQANAERLPFADASFDCITIGFGLRNVTDKDAALRSMARCLKPGGRLLILEFSKPLNGALGKLYDEYSFKVLPLLGKVVAQDEGAYRYLAESIRMHPDQETLKKMMEAAGLSRCQVYNLTGGIVAVHRGYRV